MVGTISTSMSSWTGRLSKSFLLAVASVPLCWRAVAVMKISAVSSDVSAGLNSDLRLAASNLVCVSSGEN